MKIKKVFVLILAVLMLCSLTACSETPPETEDWVWVRDQHISGAISDTGYYYIQKSILHYFDFAANAGAVLCSKADCLHKDENCDAYLQGLMTKPLYFYNDRLYYFDQAEPVLYSRNATGMDLKKIGTVGEQYMKEKKSVAIANCAVAGGYLYYQADVTAEVVEEDDSITTKLERKYIGRIDLATGKDEILIEQILDNPLQKLILCAVQKNGILLSRWEGMEEMDRNDPAYIDAIGKIPVTLEYWNGNTGETEVLFRKTIKECASINMVSDGKVYYKTLSHLDAENAGYTYSYDLNTGKEETVCAMNARAYLGGSYVQCIDPETKKSFIYDMATDEKLPYELGISQYVHNVSGKGYVLSLSDEEKIRYYYVTKDSLADGLQETDLQFMYAQKMGITYD